MPSAAMIAAQAVPGLLNAFPGWKLPTHMRAVANIGAAGAATMDPALTTPGLVLTRAIAGTYQLTFPACKHVAEFVGNVAPATPSTAANHRTCHFLPASDAVANGGAQAFVTLDAATPSIADPNNGSVLDVSFWADLG
jgi:hypothetical protein